MILELTKHTLAKQVAQPLISPIIRIIIRVQNRQWKRGTPRTKTLIHLLDNIKIMAIKWLHYLLKYRKSTPKRCLLVAWALVVPFKSPKIMTVKILRLMVKMKKLLSASFQIEKMRSAFVRLMTIRTLT